MMKHPTEDDFTVVEVFESGVSVLFEPTQSFYTFYRLADPNDIKRFGPVSPEPDNIRHAGPSNSQRAGCALRAELRFFARWV
jgi:hypothetical protein